MAYWLDGTLFVKRFEAKPGVQYPDHGCNAESSCNNQFVELETLSPLGVVSPRQIVIHTELWEIYESLNVPFIPDEIRKMVDEMNS
jgi:hypothetical protein